MEHPDRDKDIMPLGNDQTQGLLIQSPASALRIDLSYRDHVLANEIQQN